MKPVVVTMSLEVAEEALACMERVERNIRQYWCKCGEVAKYQLGKEVMCDDHNKALPDPSLSTVIKVTPELVELRAIVAWGRRMRNPRRPWRSSEST